MGPGDFLRQLWGERPPGFVHLWTLKTKRTLWLPASETADMAMGAQTVANGEDVYCSVALSAKRMGVRQRLTAEAAVGIAGLWLDVDVAGPTHDHGLASIDVAKRLVHSKLQPTLVVDSGYGVHAWWLLADGPWRFRSRTEQAEAASLARRWHTLHGLGETSDLARVLRLPGTLNAKVPGSRRPVKVIERGPRYDLLALRHQVADVSDVAPAGRGQLELGGITTSGKIAPEVLAALLANSEDFADAWHHRRKLGDGSLSAYDMSIASQAAHAGLPDEQIAGLIAAHRLHHDPKDTKHNRPDYIQRTIATARTSGKRDQAMAVFTNALGPARAA